MVNSWRDCKIGESLQEGVAREFLEETGVEVRVLDLIEVFDRIFLENETSNPPHTKNPRFTCDRGLSLRANQW